MADAHRRRFDAVAVWKFDRFARSVSHLLRALETFKALGIDFVSLSEQVDTSTPTGEMVFTVLGAVAELERSLICERVRAGIRNAKAKGRRLGRPRVTVDAARIAALRAQGHSWGTILSRDRLDAGNRTKGALCVFDPLIRRKGSTGLSSRARFQGNCHVSTWFCMWPKLPLSTPRKLTQAFFKTRTTAVSTTAPPSATRIV